MNDTTARCPDRTELKAFAEDPLKVDRAALAQHVWGCDRCRDALLEVLLGEAPAETTPAEDAFIAKFTAEHCRPAQTAAERLQAFVAARRLAFVSAPVEYALAAAPAGAAAVESDAVTPDEEVRFVFAADEKAGCAGFWRAELTIPPQARPETMVGICVTGADRRPVGGGTLKMAGCALPLEEGRTEMPFSLFLDGIRDTDVSLARPGADPVAGRLLFF